MEGLRYQGQADPVLDATAGASGGELTMDVREKLVELLWEYDQMRMMKMSIEECADRLILKGLTVTKCQNDTKCFDSEVGGSNNGWLKRKSN